MAKVIEVDETQFNNGQETIAAVQKMLAHPKAALLVEQAKKLVYPDSPTPRIDASKQANEPLEAMQKKIEDYKKTIERYESEPETKEGKKELLVTAKEHEAARDHAIRQDPWFDYAEGMLQIAIVLLSVSIVAGLPVLYWAGTVLGALGALSAANGFFLFY